MYWAYHTARTGFFLGTGNFLANQAGMDLYGTSSDDPDAQEKLLEGYGKYVLDYFKLYEQDVENI